MTETQRLRIDRNMIAKVITLWCVANGEEFLPNPLADAIVTALASEPLYTAPEVAERERAAFIDGAGYGNSVGYPEHRLTEAEALRRYPGPSALTKTE